MTAHELARILLKCPDLPVATMANGHQYQSENHLHSHGPLQIGVHVANYGTKALTIGNGLDYANTNNFHPFEILHSGRED